MAAAERAVADVMASPLLVTPTLLAAVAVKAAGPILLDGQAEFVRELAKKEITNAIRHAVAGLVGLVEDLPIPPMTEAAEMGWRQARSEIAHMLRGASSA